MAPLARPVASSTALHRHGPAVWRHRHQAPARHSSQGRSQATPAWRWSETRGYLPKFQRASPPTPTPLLRHQHRLYRCSNAMHAACAACREHMQNSVGPSCWPAWLIVSTGSRTFMYGLPQCDRLGRPLAAGGAHPSAAVLSKPLWRRGPGEQPTRSAATTQVQAAGLCSCAPHAPPDGCACSMRVRAPAPWLRLLRNSAVSNCS